MGEILSCHDPRASTLESYKDVPYQKRPEPGKCLLSDAGTYQSERAPEVTLHHSASPGSRRHQKFLVPDVLPKSGDVNRNGGELLSQSMHSNIEMEESCHTLPKRRSFRKPRLAPPPPPLSKDDRSRSRDNCDISSSALSANGKIHSASALPLATSTPFKDGFTSSSEQHVNREASASSTPVKPARRIKRGSSAGITESSSNSSVRSSPPTLPRRAPPKPPRSFTYKRASRASGCENSFISEMTAMDMSIGSKLESLEHNEIYENLSYAMRSKRIWQVFAITKDLLIDRLDPQIMMCRLSEARLITVDEESEVYNRRHRMELNQSILDVLLSKSDEEFDDVCKCLHMDECHHVLADILDVVNGVFKIVHSAKQADRSVKPGESAILLAKNINCDVTYFDRATGRKRPVIELDDTKSMLSVTFDNSMDDMCSSPSTFSFDKDRLVPQVSVDVFEQQLYHAQVASLAKLLETHSCISELSLAKGGLDGESLSLLANALERNSGLTKLDLRLNPTSNEGLHSMANVLKRNCSLKSLNLSHTSLISGGARELLDMLSSNDTLEELDVSFNELDDGDCAYLGSAIKENHSLQNMRARSNAISAIGCREIFKALCTNDHLVVLDISSNDLGDDGAAAISLSMPNVRGLKELNLEKCKIGSPGAVKIANGLRENTCIENLSMSMNSIGDEGACAFANMLRANRTLTSLSMNMCAICRPGFSQLVDCLDANETLRVLKVCFNNLAKNHELSTPLYEGAAPVSPSQMPLVAPDPLINRVQEILGQRDIQVLLWGSRLDS